MNNDATLGPSLPEAAPADKKRVGALGQGYAGWLLLVAVAAGDFLLWGYYPSLALALFFAFLVALQLTNTWHRQTATSIGGVILLTGVGLVPLLETFNFLTFVIALGTTFAACFFASHKLPERWAARAEHYVVAALLSFIRLPQFVVWSSYASAGSTLKARVLQWAIPVIFATVFVALFAEANPIWQRWLEAIDIEALLAIIFSARSMFWLALAWFALPFIQRAQPLRRFMRWTWRSEGAAAAQPWPNHVQLIQRCLILVNIVFALQTGLDATYLWAGAALPNGMTYAEYAHRGAYPLVLASLLAGAFVLVTMRPGGAGEQSVVVKWLVLLWIAQNLMLLGASVERLLLYVAHYSLTYWRLAAFIWMALVAIGLVLIIVRFVTGKSSTWLLGANAAVLGATLYATALVNFPHVIATYNLGQYGQHGKRLDANYLCGLGPLAWPALDRFMQEYPDRGREINPSFEKIIRLWQSRLSYQIGTDWREWSFRGQRLQWFVAHRENGTNDSLKRPETIAP